jgi:ribosome-associated translation inhibitor RaiA
MGITIRRTEDHNGRAAVTRAAAEIDDAIRGSLFFTLLRHGVRADLVHVALGRSEDASGVRHHCTVTGAVEGIGVFRVWGESDGLHLAIERALHRLEMWLVRERLTPRADAPRAAESVRRAA